MKMAFIGLGVMGYPMAGHLQKAGHDVCVFNRTTEKAKDWCKEYGGNMAANPAAAVKDCDIVLVCVGNDDDVREVVLGDNGALSAMQSDSILVDHTTASANLARELFDVSTCARKALHGRAGFWRSSGCRERRSYRHAGR